MTPSERWPAILLQLEPDRWKRAEDLARELGVSERTVYRDVQAMVEAGLPLQGVPGKGYRVPEDYLLAPITFTTDEAIMLVLGSAYAARNFEGRYQAAADSARRKIDSVLPSEARERAFSLQGSVHLVPPSIFGLPSEDGRLKRVRQALVEERTLQLLMSDGGSDPRSMRLDPYGLVRNGPVWHVVGYSAQKKHVVHVRIQDIDDLTLTDELFKRPESYRTSRHGPETDQHQTVRILFDAEVASSVQMEPTLEVVEKSRTPDGGLRMVVSVNHELELLPWLLSWGRYVRVLEPRALRQRLAAEAQAVVHQYREPPTLLD